MRNDTAHEAIKYYEELKEEISGGANVVDYMSMLKSEKLYQYTKWNLVLLIKHEEYSTDDIKSE